MSTVLVVGATGNIGVAAVIAALRSKHKVLAIVRNQASADKLFEHAGTKEGITTVEADVTSEAGVQGVVDQVKAGKLPAFQHVHAACGAWMGTPLNEISLSEFHKVMNINFNSNFYAYRATIPYLLEQNANDSTWTQCTGAAPEFGVGGVTGVAQGALIAMMPIATKENEKTNVRVNEHYLAQKVEYDSVAEKNGSIKASEYANVYEEILGNREIRGCRLSVYGKEDLMEFKVKKLLGKEWSVSA